LLRLLPHLTGYPFGGRSSPASQPIAAGEVIGSVSSHCKHVGMRGPLPPGGNINTSGLPQRAQFKVLGVSLIA
jgi:hypothetical protein